jgi:hypothetical protein
LFHFVVILPKQKAKKQILKIPNMPFINIQKCGLIDQGKKSVRNKNRRHYSSSGQLLMNVIEVLIGLEQADAVPSTNF